MLQFPKFLCQTSYSPYSPNNITAEALYYTVNTSCGSSTMNIPYFSFAVTFSFHFYFKISCFLPIMVTNFSCNFVVFLTMFYQQEKRNINKKQSLLQFGFSDITRGVPMWEFRFLPISFIFVKIYQSPIQY